MSDDIPSSGPVSSLVYPAISHDEFGRLLRKYGYDAEVIVEHGRIGYRTLTVPRFSAWMQTPFRGRPDEFAAIFLFERYFLTPPLSAEVVRALGGALTCAHAYSRHQGGFMVDHTLIVCGGITEYYLRDELWRWQRDLERVRKEIGRHCRQALGTTVH